MGCDGGRRRVVEMAMDLGMRCCKSDAGTRLYKKSSTRREESKKSTTLRIPRNLDTLMRSGVTRQGSERNNNDEFDVIG